MQGIEKTLRETLAKLGSPDAEARQKLYRATGDIFERSLSPYVQSHPQMVAERRKELQDIIDKLEHEFDLSGGISQPIQEPPHIQIDRADKGRSDNEGLNGIRPERQTDPSPHSETSIVHASSSQSSEVSWPDAETVRPPQNIPITSDLPTVSAAPIETKSNSHPDPDLSAVAPERKQPELKPAVPLGDVRPTDIRPEPAKVVKEKPLTKKIQKRQKKRGLRLMNLIAGSVVTVIFITFLAVGAWLLFESEYYQLFLDWRNGTQSTNVIANSQDDSNFVPKPLTASSEQSTDWVEIFGYQNVSNVQGRGEVIVDQIGTDETSGVRITSVNSSEFGEAVIPLDPRILSTAASNKIALAISLAVEEPTQIYVRCVIKSGVQTTRRRFQLDGGPNEIIIEMDLTGVANINSQPFIAINSDISGQGRPVDLFKVNYQVLR